MSEKNIKPTKFGDHTDGKRYNLEIDEKETYIIWNDAIKTAKLYSCNVALVHRMDKLAVEYPGECACVAEDACSKSYTIPKKWVSIRPPKKMNYTDEQKKEMSERARRTFAKK